MHLNYIIIPVMLALCAAVLRFAWWFDRRYYIPFLNANMLRRKREPVYEPNLLSAGLLAAGGGLLICSLVGAVWIWVFHK